MSNLLIYNKITFLFLSFFTLSFITFAQVDLSLKRNFSDSITNTYKIIVKIPESNEKIIHQIYKLSSSTNAINYDDFLKEHKKIISFFENEGYPFISYYFDSLATSNDTVFVSLIMEKERYIVFDSIVTKGNLKISNSFLIPYLSFYKGKKYKERLVEKITKLISEITFADLTQPSGIDFIDNKAVLFLFMNKKKVNQFDGIIGFAPVNQNSGKIGFTGELKLKLLNTLSYGETFDLQWRAPENRSQLLDVFIKLPFVFKTPFGIDALFNLDKKDTSYIKLNTIASILYSFNGNNYVKTFIDYATSNPIGIVSTSNENVNLPFESFTKLMYGTALFLRDLDFIYNPRKGYQLLIHGAFGTKTNPKENESLKRSSFLIDGKGFIPIYKKWIAVLGIKGGTLIGDNLLINELFRIGGINTLQGFDELSIYASSYTIGHLEIRFLYEKLSYLNIFFNGGWYEKNSKQEYITDTPFGIGVGVAFNTNAGIFNISYALGKQLDNPISFKTGKIHFGIMLTF